MTIRSLHHVSFNVTDLAKTKAFAEDFGLHTVQESAERLVMRTGGGDAWCYEAVQAGERGFNGLGFMVENESDLQGFVDNHGATAIRELDTPGGGKAVTLTHPEGLKIDLVHGIAGDTPVEVRPELRINTPAERTRHDVPQTARPLSPTVLYRLGHTGLYTKDYRASSAWFQEVLGMKVSDEMHIPGNPQAVVVAFLRIDRGAEHVDHHSIFLAQSEKSDLHHMSFEAQDFEAQMMAHRYLLAQGHEPNWGVGRHPLGSHVFDVWFGPDRYRFETFTDTDLINADHPAGLHDISKHDLDSWTDQAPDSYFD